jgi:hypothetical protein
MDAGPSGTSCPMPSNIYAHENYENTYYDATGLEYGDVVIRFYADNALTVPISLYGVTVNYNITHQYDGSTSTPPAITGSTNASYIVIATNVKLTEFDPTCPPGPPYQDCPQYFIFYELLAGNYIIQ